MKTRLKLVLTFGLLVCLGAGYAWTRLGTWLAEADPPRKAEVIVCLSSPDRIRKAARLFREGRAPRIILTVAVGKKALTDLGVPEDRITLAPGPRTTYQEALVVAPLLQQAGVGSALIVSDPYHLRRVRWTFRQVLGRLPIRLSFVASDLPWNGKKWRQGEKEKFYVYSEVPKIGWYWLAHGLLGIKDDPPWAVAWKHRYEKWLRSYLSVTDHSG